MTGGTRWKVTSFEDHPGAVHVSPEHDTFEHHTEMDGECWCGQWYESVDGVVIVHHLNATERLSSLAISAGQ